MTNKTFHKIMLEWNANYRYNSVFKKFVDSTSIRLTTNDEPLNPEDGRNLIKQYKKTHKVWFRDYYDASIYIDFMPFGTNVGEDVKEFIEWQKHNK